MLEIPKVRKTLATALLATVAFSGCTARPSPEIVASPSPKAEAPSPEEMGCRPFAITLNATMQKQMIAAGHWTDSLPPLPAHQGRIIALQAFSHESTDPNINPMGLRREQKIVEYFFKKYENDTPNIAVQLVGNVIGMQPGDMGLNIYDESCTAYMAAQSVQPTHDS